MSSQIDNLSNEFNILINKYQETYNKYINVIGNDDKKFKSIENMFVFPLDLFAGMQDTALHASLNIASKLHRCQKKLHYDNIFFSCTYTSTLPADSTSASPLTPSPPQDACSV